MRSRPTIVVALTLAVAGALTGCRSEEQPAAGVRASDVGLPSATQALAELDALTVRGRAPRTGYSRAQYGKAWADVDRNGCDNRSDIMNRDLSAITHKSGTRGCVVLRGQLTDPYTGTTLTYVRGGVDEVNADHVVPLSDSWQKGAAGWSVEKRTAFANDPLNLLAVTTSSNQAKGDSDAASWLPPAKSYRCPYVTRQVSVKTKYRLWVTRAESDKIRETLRRCTT